MSRKTHRRLQRLCRVLCGLCFLWLLGIVGSSDLGTYTLTDVLTQAPLAAIGFGLFAWLGGLVE